VHQKIDRSEPSLPHDLAQSEGVDLSGCDGSAACSAVCPVADSFDLLPHQVVRQTILNCRDRALRTSAIWLCTECGRCTAACPNGVDVARLFSELRRRASRLSLDPAPDADGVKASYEAMLEELDGSSRPAPARVALSYKVRSFDLFTDLALGASLWARGRLALFARGGGEGGLEAVRLARSRERERLLEEEDTRTLRRQVARKGREDSAKAAHGKQGEQTVPVATTPEASPCASSAGGSAGDGTGPRGEV
jgi:heterodisulfide reductase subunit C